MEQAGFRGYDPYDALTSPLFRLPLLRCQRTLRFGAQQVLKRMPLNLRPWLRIPKGHNPVTVGNALQGFAYLACCDRPRAEDHRMRVSRCLHSLARLRSVGWSGDCWGYDFDWEGRYARLPARTPTVVATGLITNALFATYRILGDEEALEMCKRASRFVVRDLNRTPGDDGSFCWSYSPIDSQQVLNASMMGARLCAQVFSVTGEAELADAAGRAACFVARHQSVSGAWPYSAGDARRWADNFHTGYVLECLDEYSRCTGDTSFAAATSRGWSYYRERFFVDDRIPKYYDARIHPIDPAACAQSIVTLMRFGDIQAATRSALWTLEHMQRREGWFDYQVRRRYTNRINYLRWSTAPMFSALAQLACANSEGQI